MLDLGAPDTTAALRGTNPAYAADLYNNAAELVVRVAPRDERREVNGVRGHWRAVREDLMSFFGVWPTLVERHQDLAVLFDLDSFFEFGVEYSHQSLRDLQRWVCWQDSWHFGVRWAPWMGDILDADGESLTEVERTCRSLIVEMMRYLGF